MTIPVSAAGTPDATSDCGRAVVSADPKTAKKEAGSDKVDNKRAGGGFGEFMRGFFGN
jgi:hypothetical protein